MLSIENLVGLIGWIGVACCTLGFLLLNTKVIRFDSWIYQLINVVGGIGLVTSAIYFRDMPNITSNTMWAVIALYGLIKSISERKRAAKS